MHMKFHCDAFDPFKTNKYKQYKLHISAVILRALLLPILQTEWELEILFWGKQQHVCDVCTEFDLYLEPEKLLSNSGTLSLPRGE